jgi:hypothetical protein
MNAMPHSQPGRSSVHAFSRPAAAPADAGTALGEADLRRIEQAMLDAILDVHPDGTNALDRLLDDMEAADGAHDDTSPVADRDAGQSRRKQVEALLLAAVLDTTPADRNRELDRLLGETPDPGTYAAYA